MCKMQPPLVCEGWNLYSLRKNPRFYLSLTLGFLLCWLLTDKTMQISRTYLTSVQLVEPFVWCYADGDSILYAALVLMLMLSAELAHRANHHHADCNFRLLPDDSA